MPKTQQEYERERLARKPGVYVTDPTSGQQVQYGSGAVPRLGTESRMAEAWQNEPRLASLDRGAGSPVQGAGQMPAIDPWTGAAMPNPMRSVQFPTAATPQPQPQAPQMPGIMPQIPEIPSWAANITTPLTADQGPALAATTAMPPSGVQRPTVLMTPTPRPPPMSPMQKAQAQRVAMTRARMSGGLTEQPVLSSDEFLNGDAPDSIMQTGIPGQTPNNRNQGVTPGMKSQYRQMTGTFKENLSRYLSRHGNTPWKSLDEYTNAIQQIEGYSPAIQDFARQAAMQLMPRDMKLELERQKTVKRSQEWIEQNGLGQQADGSPALQIVDPTGRIQPNPARMLWEQKQQKAYDFYKDQQKRMDDQEAARNKQRADELKQKSLVDKKKEEERISKQQTATVAAQVLDPTNELGQLVAGRKDPNKLGAMERNYPYIDLQDGTLKVASSVADAASKGRPVDRNEIVAMVQRGDIVMDPRQAEQAGWNWMKRSGVASKATAEDIEMARSLLSYSAQKQGKVENGRPFVVIPGMGNVPVDKIGTPEVNAMIEEVANERAKLTPNKATAQASAAPATAAAQATAKPPTAEPAITQADIDKYTKPEERERFANERKTADEISAQNQIGDEVVQAATIAGDAKTRMGILWLKERFTSDLNELAAIRKEREQLEETIRVATKRRESASEKLRTLRQQQANSRKQQPRDARG